MALFILEVKCCGTKALDLQVRAGMGLCGEPASICVPPASPDPGPTRGPGACSRHQFWFPGSRPADASG